MPKRSLEDVFAESPWQPKRGRACKTTSATERRKSVCAPARSSKPASVPKQRKHAESPASKTVTVSTGSRRRGQVAKSKQSEKKRKCLTDVFSRLQSCDDGDVWAMDARQHAEQHPDPRQHQESCARCRFLARRHLWEDIGSSRLPGQSDKVKLRWLAERPRHLASSSGSKWGIGCVACANLMSRMGGETRGTKLRVGTKWATFSVRSWSNMQAESIKLLCLEFGKFSVS